MNKLHKEVLPNQSFSFLQGLMSNPEFQDFHLVGGTGLALLIGHRESIDLDLFSQKEFKSNLTTKVARPLKVISNFDNSIEFIADDTKTFLFYFAYPTKKKLITIENIRIADPIDIGLMKLLAIQGKTTKKDIIDLYFIDREIIELKELLEIFEKHYPKDSFNEYKSFQSLIDFSVIENDPEPKMLKSFEWEKAKKLIEDTISNHIIKISGINNYLKN